MGRSIAEKLGWRNVRALDCAVEAIVYENSTPAFKFTYVGFGFRDGHIGVVPSRGAFDHELAKRTVELSFEVCSLRHGDQACRVHPGLEGVRFDCIVEIAPVEAGFSFDRETSLLTRAIHPCYRCEFTGIESYGELDFVVHHAVDCLDWGREPSPAAFLAFFNAQGKYGSRSKKPKRTSMADCLGKLEAMLGAPGSWAVIKNRIGEELRIEIGSSGAGLVSGRVAFTDKASIAGMVNTFLCKPRGGAETPPGTR